MKGFGSKTVPLLVVLAGVALASGLTFAGVALTHSDQQARGDHTNYSGTVTGLTYYSSGSGTVSNPAPSASTGTANSPQPLVAGANKFCATSCVAANQALLIQYNFSTSLSGSISIAFTVTAGSGSGSTTLYFAQASTAVTGTILVSWDVGATIPVTTSVTLVIHQCSGPTCP